MRQLFHCLQWYAGSKRVKWRASSNAAARSLWHDHDVIIIQRLWPPTSQNQARDVRRLCRIGCFSTAMKADNSSISETSIFEISRLVTMQLSIHGKFRAGFLSSCEETSGYPATPSVATHPLEWGVINMTLSQWPHNHITCQKIKIF